ncbi:hypothetical protein [Lutimonas sp.]|uniref:hypothetical protein n=1 Tax=Lutimonas sp. TaxID=1872403 RepID=UPI003D9B253B
MNKFVCAFFIISYSFVYSQDTIYLGEFGSKVLQKKEMATKYRFVTEDPLQKEVYKLSTFHMDGSIHSKSTYQAVNLVLNMPKWSPAMQDGHPVKVKMTLPIRLQ